jgi:hypothetical protein
VTGPTRPNARVLLDSVNPRGDRVTTMEVTLWRANAVDLVTHRALSRNGASSRAIPITKFFEKVLDDPVVPRMQLNGPGMTPGPDLEGYTLEEAERLWLLARDEMAHIAHLLEQVGVHKSVVNRLLEPFSWMTYVVTATDWDNFFAQRCSTTNPPQHELYLAACAMRDALAASKPRELDYGEWHTPLIQPDEVDFYGDLGEDMEWARPRVSAARCARVSYLTHAGVRDVKKDLELYDRLVTADPPHWSPLEHVCTPDPALGADQLIHGPSDSRWVVGSARPANLRGWVQFRHVVESESETS